MKAALRLDSVHKSYGRVHALNGLSFEVPQGSVCGLVGPNGAGKTTAFAIIGGLVRPDSGLVDLLGDGPFDVVRHRGRVGLLPQDAELSPHTPVRGLLQYYGSLQGMTRAKAATEAERLLDEVGLLDKATARVRELSHGMRRRVAVAQALLGDPPLVLLDEPTSGLDPELVVRMRSLFRSRQGRSTLIISSHQLGELESTCDHVVFMEQGTCIVAGAMAEVTGATQKVFYKVSGVPAAPAPDGVEPSVVDGGIDVTVPRGSTVPELNAKVLLWLLQGGVDVEAVQPGEGLEAAWLARSGRSQEG